MEPKFTNYNSSAIDINIINQKNKIMRKINLLLNCDWVTIQLLYNTKKRINLTLLKTKSFGAINSFQSNTISIKALNIKTILLFFGLLVISVEGNSQVQKIHFEYDDFGNQVERKLCLGCSSKTTTTDIKKFSDLKEEDLLKFFPNDVITYYPNPVKEELFLKWELINETKVSTIEIFDMNGKLLKSYKDLNNNTNLTIPYYDYPIGTYFITLRYTSGENKSIKIIKN